MRIKIEFEKTLSINEVMDVIHYVSHYYNIGGNNEWIGSDGQLKIDRNNKIYYIFYAYDKQNELNFRLDVIN